MHAIGSQIVSASHRPPVVCNFGWAVFYLQWFFWKDTEVTTEPGLLLRRNKGESLKIFCPSDKSFGTITVTYEGRGNIRIDAPKHLAIQRSELAGKGGAK